MDKPTRNELLAEYYLRAAGVAAVWIDADGNVGAHDVAWVEIEPDSIVYCCERGVHFTLAYRLYEWKKEADVDQAAVAAKLEELADLGGVGLTPHEAAIDRAMAAVAAVNEAIDKMGSTGELRELNAAFKAARLGDPSVKYVDYLKARKPRCWSSWRARVVVEPAAGASSAAAPNQNTDQECYRDRV